jgi:MFS transporter, ACS family, allantoate permease
MCDFVLLLTIRHMLVKENKRRGALPAGPEQDAYGYVERQDADGTVVRQKVDKGLLDLTDRQNLSFRYAL